MGEKMPKPVSLNEKKIEKESAKLAAEHAKSLASLRQILTSETDPKAAKSLKSFLDTVDGKVAKKPKTGGVVKKFKKATK